MWRLPALFKLQHEALQAPSNKQAQKRYFTILHWIFTISLLFLKMPQVSCSVINCTDHSKKLNKIKKKNAVIMNTRKVSEYKKIFYIPLINFIHHLTRRVEITANQTQPICEILVNEQTIINLHYFINNPIIATSFTLSYFHWVKEQ